MVLITMAPPIQEAVLSTLSSATTSSSSSSSSSSIYLIYLSLSGFSLCLLQNLSQGNCGLKLCNELLVSFDVWSIILIVFFPDFGQYFYKMSFLLAKKHLSIFWPNCLFLLANLNFMTLLDASFTNILCCLGCFCLVFWKCDFLDVLQRHELSLV